MSEERVIGGNAVLAADIGATNVRLAVVDGDRVLRSAARVTRGLTRSPGDGIVPALAEAMLALVHNDGGTGILAAGIGLATFVDREGVVLRPGMLDIPVGPLLRDRLVEALGVPVVVDNDANVAALGELHYGAARGLDDFVLVTLGTNIGAGIVCDGRIVRGAHGAAGEVGMLLVPARHRRAGHAVVADAGPLGQGASQAASGYAWLEELAGGKALAARLTRDRRPSRGAGPPASDGPRSAHTGSAHRGSSRPDQTVFTLAASGDPFAATVLSQAIEAWALLVADLAAAFDPSAVILSGGLVEESDHFLAPLRRRAAELCPFPPEIRVGQLGPQAGLIGAAVAARSVIATSEARPVKESASPARKHRRSMGWDMLSAGSPASSRG